MQSVSLVIPVLNEEKYIRQFLESILLQDYDFKNLEMIFIDGNSDDSTIQVITNFMDCLNVDYKVLINEKKITPISLNIGIIAAKNEIIIRLDAHSTYPNNYIQKCVYYINKIDGADNVGCLIDTVSEGVIGNSIAYVLSSKFGVGNSKFRTNAKSGFVDTVPFGTFRRTLFDEIGFFDERLARNQDSEFNFRIIKNGGKIYLFNDIKIQYFPRDNIKSLLKMALMNGKWNIYTNSIMPGSMKVRHFIPLIFVVALLIGLVNLYIGITFINYLFIFEIIAYMLLNFYFSILSKNLKVAILVFIIYPLFHIFYGIGSLLGIYMTFKKNQED